MTPDEERNAETGGPLEGKEDLRWVLPKRLRRGLREALDAGRGRLRMDPEDLAELLGKAIDSEVARLARVRREVAQRKRIAAMLRGAAAYVAPIGTRGAAGGPRHTADTDYGADT